MSADNWSICPKCKAASELKIHNDHLELGKSYGTVPAEKYQAMVSLLKRPEPLKETLREDYELGITDKGEFYCGYSASCNVCEFHFSFNEKIKPETVLKTK